MDREPASALRPVETLLENHRAFLQFLERRVGDRALAEDILQDAFIKLVERPDQAPADEGVVPWFYRTLRNAAIDRFRRQGTADRATAAFAQEIETHQAPTSDVEAEICACISRLAKTLKPEYAEALQAIDIHGTAVKTFAEQHQLSASNAGVRVFRARQALKKKVKESCGVCADHGCVDCTCRQYSKDAVGSALTIQGAVMEKDLVCGMQVDPAKAAGTSEYQGKTYYFCAKGCKTKFDANPAQYVK